MEDKQQKQGEENEKAELEWTKRGQDRLWIFLWHINNIASNIILSQSQYRISLAITVKSKVIYNTR